MQSFTWLFADVFPLLSTTPQAVNVLSNVPISQLPQTKTPDMTSHDQDLYGSEYASPRDPKQALLRPPTPSDGSDGRVRLSEGENAKLIRLCILH